MTYNPYYTLPSFNCTYGSASNQTANARYGIGGALGLAFSSIQDANNNWSNARNNAIATNNHWILPNGTHDVNGMKIIKGNGYIRYEHPNGHCHGITDDGGHYWY